jgi:type IV secretory pathway protease TraF
MTAQKPTGKKLKWICVAMAVIAGLIGSQLPGRLFITLTPSIKYRLLWLTSDVKNVGTGDYVVFLLDKKKLLGLPLPTELAEDEDGIISAVKRIGCDEGKVLSRTGKDGLDFFCGERFLGRAKEKTRKGVPLEPARAQGVIPPGMAFMVGDNKDSFDSRYFGLVNKKSFVSRANGIF